MFRRERAEEHGVPPYVIFSDATLRELARLRPTSLGGLLAIHGIGEKKAGAYGDELIHEIRSYCDRAGIDTDVGGAPHAKPGRAARANLGERPVSAAKRAALEMFARGESVERVQQSTSRARSTVMRYLVEFIEQEGISDGSPWIDDATLERIRAACRAAGVATLRPIFDALGGAVSYDEIRIAMACLRNEPAWNS
jgi:ATP-dependent DNA helicase RecQ